ncbi:MAG: CPBP family intramembrane metalloprotease [Clostridia bacterium]|nr:CPBP family intramembrane metalloprotease [Clostridia bacterium]
MDSPEISFDFKSAKKPFSRIGIALVLFFAATFTAQEIIVLAANALLPEWLSGITYTEVLIISQVTMYLIGLPIFYLAVRRLDKEPPAKMHCSAKTVGTAFLIAMALTYIGQIIGEFVFSLLYDTLDIAFTSDTFEIINNITWYEALISTVIIGPLVEEFMFRKVIIDRTRMYGEKLSLIFSALMFAFFHMSVEQFFYAFFAGLLLGYLYLRRGKLLYCWILHALFNFFGAVLPIILYNFVDMEAFLSAATAEEMYKLINDDILGYGLISLFSLATMAMSVIGFYLLLKKYKSRRFEEVSLKLPKDSEATVAFTNVGVILFVLFAIAYPFITSFIKQL